MPQPNSIAWVRDRVVNPPAPSGGEGGGQSSVIEVPGATPQD